MTWPQANGASRYRVEIRNDKGRVVRTRETGESGLAAGAFRLPPGNYVARVATIDPSGLEAAKPAERPLRVVGVTVPERGFVDVDGAVHLPTGDSLSLTNTDGVEMTYGGGDYFVAAPRSLDLVQPEPRLVRFRLPGNPSEARLWLVPRQVRARVEFGPKVPTWPRDSLEIRVRVEEASASASAPPIDVRARVMLGVEPVNVAFVREGNVLRGVLPPQVGKGPWVVRVEVNDPSGAELGRDFIEVARR
jgi:hypothetical protein